MHINALAAVLLPLVPLVPATTTPIKESDIEARAEDPFVSTSDSVSLALKDGNITPAGSDAKRRACPGGAVQTGAAVVQVTTVS
ncbi:hypothetical protein OPQ81_002766 [Rhizoctonia solani]|nr:hypothetical protein OPQ81_002766 [Rhizoctonia solani]